MRMHVVLLVTVLGSAFSLAAQDAADSVGNAKLGKRVPLPFGNFIDMVGTPKCDGSGNVLRSARSHGEG